MRFGSLGVFKGMQDTLKRNERNSRKSLKERHDDLENKNKTWLNDDSNLNEFDSQAFYEKQQRKKYSRIIILMILSMIIISILFWLF